MRFRTNRGGLSGTPDMDLVTLTQSIHTLVGCWQSALMVSEQSKLQRAGQPSQFVMALPVSKAGVKGSQLTEPPATPHLYLCEQPDTIPVQGAYPPHRILGWLSEDEVRQLLRDRKVFPCQYTRNKIHAVRYIPDRQEIEDQVPIRTDSYGDPHQRETDQNPEGVWTFDHIPRWARKVFRAVVDSCKAA